jgi:hypothetical protein
MMQEPTAQLPEHFEGCLLRPAAQNRLSAIHAIFWRRGWRLRTLVRKCTVHAAMSAFS